MQLAREPLALELLPLEQRTHGAAADTLGQLDRDRSAVGECLCDPHVGVGKARAGAALVVGDDNAHCVVAHDQRHVESGARLDETRRALVDLWIVDQRVDSLATAPLECPAGLRAPRVDPETA